MKKKDEMEAMENEQTDPDLRRPDFQGEAFSSYANQVAEDLNTAILSEISDEPGEDTCPKCEGPVQSLDQINAKTGRRALSALIRCPSCKCSLGLSAFGSEIEIISDPSEKP